MNASVLTVERYCTIVLKVMKIAVKTDKICK